MFKLTETEPKAKKLEITALIKEKLETLSLKIPEIRFINIGVNINDPPNGFDMILATEFDSIHDLETYRVHPEHRKVVEFINEYKSQSALVDYEV